MTDKRTHAQISQAVQSAARNEARRVGVPFITRRAVARLARVPEGSLRLYGSMEDIKRMAASQINDTTSTTNRHIAGAAERDKRVLEAALGLAADVGYRQITRSAVAARAGVSVGTVSHFGGSGRAPLEGASGLDGLRVAVMRAAIERELVTIIAQGLTAGDALALAAPEELRARALASVMSS